MSEYQYYEFRAIDGPLNQKQMGELRALSTRAEITPTSFTNEYNFGSFKGDPNKLIERYFDAFLYVANWGTHRLMFRIPLGLLDMVMAKDYCSDEVLSLRTTKEHVILEFVSEEEGSGEWTKGEGWMDDLALLRAELMRGDLRALYLGWLAWVNAGVPYDDDDEEDEDFLDELEPPVPPGLNDLSEPLETLAEFLRIDDDLLATAAEASVGKAEAGPAREDLEHWVKKLSAAEKDAYLVRLLEEEGQGARLALWKQFRESTARKGTKASPATKRRTVRQLLEARKTRSEREKQKAAAAKAQKKHEEEEQRAKYLDDLAHRESATWREVDELIATKDAKEYDRAVGLLVDLSDLAARSGRATEAAGRIRELRARHRSKSALLSRLDKKKLGR